MSTFIDGPLFDDTALVFCIRDTTNAWRSIHEFETTQASARGLGAVDAYMKSRAGARLIPLGEHAAGDPATGMARRFASSEAINRASSLATVHYLRLESPNDGASLRRSLQEDPDVEYVHYPAIQYPLIAPIISDDISGLPQQQWGLRTCGFPDMWAILEQGTDPGPIAVIDMGPVSHEDLEGRALVTHQPTSRPSLASHAMEVAGVIGAIRGDEGGEGMSGCCSAKVEVFNVWTDDQGFDSEGYYQALAQVAAKKYPVLNLSLGSTERDVTAERGIMDCLQADVTVVAAAGDDAQGSNSPIFPAAQANVIAVGGTDPFDNKTRTSKTGSHVWLCAPADRIWTLAENNGYGFQSGTSFAAAMVSAAAWLARRTAPMLTPQTTREFLACAVAAKSAPAQRNDQVGFGRLDVAKLGSLLAESITTSGSC